MSSPDSSGAPSALSNDEIKSDGDQPTNDSNTEKNIKEEKRKLTLISNSDVLLAEYELMIKIDPIVIHIGTQDPIKLFLSLLPSSSSSSSSLPPSSSSPSSLPSSSSTPTAVATTPLNSKVTCSAFVLQYKSEYFRTLIGNMSPDEGEITLMETVPQKKVVEFLVELHRSSLPSPPTYSGSASRLPLKWNKHWAELAMKWVIPHYTEAYANIASKLMNIIFEIYSLTKDKACSHCRRIISYTSTQCPHCYHHEYQQQTSHSHTGAASRCPSCNPRPSDLNICILTSLPPDIKDFTKPSSPVKNLFWEIAEVYLTHPSLMRPPISSKAALLKELAKHKSLWDKASIKRLFSYDDLYEFFEITHT